MTSSGPGVDPARRFTRTHPCPICGGHEGLPQHQGVRCYGFLSSDGGYAHCTREEYAGGLEQGPDGAYAHRLSGSCRCGSEHRAAAPRFSTLDSLPNEQSRESRNGHRPGALRRVDYHYVSADGELLAIHRRIEGPAGKKRFAWLQPSGEAGGVTLSALPLYRLGDLLDADPSEPVYFTEGEAACEALRTLGVLSVCLGGGAGQREFGEAFEPLVGRTVSILPDNDHEGHTYAAAVLAAMLSVGVRAQILELPDLPPHGDAVEWIAAGGTAAELSRLSTLLIRERVESRETGESERRPGGHPGIVVQSLAAFLAEPDDEAAWVIEGLLPQGGSSLLVAKPKAGKSTLARTLIAAVLRGDPVLDRPTAAGVCVYLAIEEKRSELKAQLRGLGLSSEPLYVATGRIEERGVPLIDQLEALVRETGAALTVIDPLYKFVRIKDGNDYAEVSRVLEPLTEVARRTGCHLCVVHHASKGGEGQDSILGSTALAAAVDTLLILKRDGAVRTLRSIQRYGDDMDEMVLAKDEHGRVAVSGTAYEAQLAEVEARVMEVVADGAFTEQQILARATGDTTLIRFALRQLVQGGFIERRGTGRRGSPYEYYPRQEGR